MDSMAVAKSHYDIIIVGGRPTGASLAARLGQDGWRVLLLDRSTFPSAPAVSYPAIFSSTMALLDEIGLSESDYARDTPRLHWWINEFREDFRVFNRIPPLHGRDYAYAIDRTRFDDALWRNAARSPYVTARQGFTVTGLLRDGGRVTGVRGHARGGPEEHFTADCVVGAGGRFDLVAREAGAEVYAERDDLPTSVYYAYWQGAEPYDATGPVVHAYAPGYGYGFLLMDSAGGMLGAGIYGQSKLLDLKGATPEAFYLKLLQAQPRVWRRLRSATRVSQVRGMRNIGNLYRRAGGPGWALAGDALHQIDPMSAQGIYDALWSAKALSRAIGDWKRGQMSWPAAVARYEAAVQVETRACYDETLARIKREIFTQRSPWAWKSYIRWLNADPEYKRRLALMMARGMDAAGWLPAPVVAGALVRGALGDVQRWLRGRPRVDALPALSPFSSSYSSFEVDMADIPRYPYHQDG